MNSKNKILHLERETYSVSSLKKLEENYDVTYASFNNQSAFDAFLKGKDFEIVFTKLGLSIGKVQMDLLCKLKIICTPTTGYNHIDEEYANQKTIQIIGLKNQKDFLSQVKSTAEHSWALMLSIARNLHPAITDTQKAKKWDRNPYLADELNEKTLGIIGYGRLGKIIGEYGQVFGMNVLAYDLDDKAFHSKPLYVEKTDLDNLLENSDYIILLISWTKENINFIDTKKISLMKKEAYLINTARGELIDEKALLKALKNNKIKGAALDVLWEDSSWDKEKTVYNELLDYSKTNNNLIITPHMGGYGKSSIEKTREFITNLFLKQST